MNKKQKEMDKKMVTLNIGGMTCAMCSGGVEAALTRTKGVFEARVNLAAENVTVRYNPFICKVAEMKWAIEGAGFRYLGEQTDAQNDLAMESKQSELKWKLIRFVTGFTLAIPLMLMMYLPFTLPGFNPYIVLAFTTPIFIFVSFPIFRAAFNSLKNLTLNMDVMYSMGMGVAYISSVLGTFNILLTRDFLFYDTVLMLASFLTLGRYLETRAKGKTSSAIQKLMGLRPQTATVIRNKTEMKIPIENIEVGDVVMVKPGERCATDGEVISGESYVDESMVTGESIPVHKKVGENVIGGTLNQNGAITFRTTGVGKDTILSKIIQLVEDAQGSRPPIQRVADRAVKYFIPVVLAISLLAFLTWFILVGETLLFSLTILISILVVACPCALGLATPTAVTVGIGRGAELGILIKNGEVLEKSEKLTTVVFDKTGTLTGGRPQVTNIHSIDLDDDEVLKLAGSVEKYSQHPLGSAIMEKVEERGIKLLNTDNFDTFAGKGITANADGKTILVGNSRFFEEKKISYEQVKRKLRKLEMEGKTVILVGFQGKVVGMIGVADTVKKEVADTVKKLEMDGIKVYMMTGDNKQTARAVGLQTGIKNIMAEVLPGDKRESVKELQNKGEVVAFVGDGINDSPALAQADIGIAMGGGTDVAMESGEIVLIKDDISNVIGAIDLSKKVMKRIKLNLFWAFAYNSALIPLAAGGLHAIWGIQFPPELAGGAMAMSSVTVVSLSLMLKRYVPGWRKKR